jgi:hypothetical protein
VSHKSIDGNRVDFRPLQLLIAASGGWLQRSSPTSWLTAGGEPHPEDTTCPQRLRFDDCERRCLAILGHGVGRRAPAQWQGSDVGYDPVLAASWWRGTEPIPAAAGALAPTC